MNYKILESYIRMYKKFGHWEHMKDRDIRSLVELHEEMTIALKYQRSDRNVNFDA